MGLFGNSNPGQPRYSGKLHNLQLTEAVLGTPLTLVIGTGRTHAKLLWYGDFTAKALPAGGGGGKGLFGGGNQNTQYDYKASIAAFVAQGPCKALLSIWDQQGKLYTKSSNVSFQIPTNGGAYTPDPSRPRAQVDLGVTVARSYSLLTNDFGGSGPRTVSGVYQAPLPPAAGTPGPGQYYFDGNSYHFNAADAGKVAAINFAYTFSLYYRDATQGAAIPTSAPYQVSTDHQSYFYQDDGITFVADGTVLKSVGGTPATGQYNQNQGVYTFAAADAGKFVLIQYNFTVSDPNITTSSVLNLTFFNGAATQAPWPYLTSKHPDAAFGYPGMAYVGAAPLDLGTSAQLPAYNYEIMGKAVFGSGWLDALPTDAILVVLTDPLAGIRFPAGFIGNWADAENYWVANGFFISQVINSQTSASSVIGTWLDAGNAAMTWSEGTLKIIPYGEQTIAGNGAIYKPNTQPVASLSWDELLPLGGDATPGTSLSEDVLQVSRTMPQDAWNYVQVSWSNRANDYNNEITPAFSQVFIDRYGLRMENAQSWDFITTINAARFAGSVRLKRNLYLSRNTYKFAVGWRRSQIEEMDVVILPDGAVVRVTAIDEDTDGKRVMTAEPFAYGAHTPSLYPAQTANGYQPTGSQAYPGDATPFLLETTLQAANGIINQFKIAAAGQSLNWGGCHVWASNDGTTYQNIGTIKSNATAGIVTAALPSHGDPDQTNTLSVLLADSSKELETVTQQQADNYATLFAITSAASGYTELLSYSTATLTAPGRYSLTYLRRGAYGSSVGSFNVGDRFALLNEAALSYQYRPQYVGGTLFFKFTSVNTFGLQEQALSDVKAYPFRLTGSSLGPPAGGTASPDHNPLGAYTDSSAVSHITVDPFVMNLSGASAHVLPAGRYTIDALSPSQSYLVYYVDYAFAGGAVQPIATQNTGDYTGKAGYYYIGSITTPMATGGGTVGTGAGGMIYRPSSYMDTGSTTTNSPQLAYDANPSSAAIISATSQYASGQGSTNYVGAVTYLGFPDTTPSGTTLSIRAQFDTSSDGSSNAHYNWSGGISASFDGGQTWVSIQSFSAAGSGSYTSAVPSGTDLNKIQVRCTASASASPTGNPNGASFHASCNLSILDITVQ